MPNEPFRNSGNHNVGNLVIHNQEEVGDGGDDFYITTIKDLDYCDLFTIYADVSFMAGVKHIEFERDYFSKEDVAILKEAIVFMDNHILY